MWVCIYGATTFWWHLPMLPPVPIDQYNDGPPRRRNSFPFHFIPTCLITKLPPQVRHDSLFNYVTLEKKGTWWIGVEALWSHKQDRKHRLPICQQSQLTALQIEAYCSFMQCCKKTRVSVKTAAKRPFLQRENYGCEWVGLVHPSAGGGESDWNLTFRALMPLLTGTDMNYSKWRIVCIRPVPGWSLKIMFRVQIDTLDISLKGQVLCSLMLPFYLQPAVGDVDYYHNLGLCQLMDAASFVLTPLNIGTQWVIYSETVKCKVTARVDWGSLLLVALVKFQLYFVPPQKP